MKRSSSIKRKTRMKPKRRSASDFARIYGSKARVAWVQSLPCAACGVTGFSENAHVVSGGMGRKADASQIVPLCGPHFCPPEFHYNGCHRVLHDIGATGLSMGVIDFAALAAATESAWQAFSGAVSGASV